MRILINDFGGYPFPIQLSKYLAGPGCEVLHTYVSNIQTPHGNMENDAAMAHVTVIPVLLKAQFSKYSFLGRFRGEYDFARQVSQMIDDFKPDLFISANTPLLAQGLLLKKCKRSGVKFIYWCQDIHSIALARYLHKRVPLLAASASRYFKWKESRLLEQSDYVITIAPGFNKIFAQWGIRQKRIEVIQNWGPINDIQVRPKRNIWSEQQQLSEKLVILYSGTLGLKHNPLLISGAAQYFAGHGDIVFVVVSEGIGADILTNQKETFGLDNLLILPYQDYNLLPDVLGTADILLSILEPDAALFSVPSKVLTYLCAQKPILLAVPEANLSARIVEGACAGYCMEPGDAVMLTKRIQELADQPQLRAELGKNGRTFAEKNFAIAAIAEKFKCIFDEVFNEKITQSDT